MAIAKYTQSPTEKKIYRVDYSSWLGDGETIASAVATATPDTPSSPFVATALLASLTDISVTISGGEADTPYTVKALVTTTAGQIKEDCIEIDVRTSCE